MNEWRQLHEVRCLIDAASFRLETFGLYLTTFEVLLMPDESFLDGQAGASARFMGPLRPRGSLS